VSVTLAPTVELEGLRLDALDEPGCVARVLAASLAGRGGWIVTPNLDHLRRLRADEHLRASYARADLSVADGMPLVWACRLQRTPLPARVCGSDLLGSLSRAAAEHGLRVYYLGGAPGTAQAAARVLGARFGALRVAGHACPTPGFEQRPGELEQLARALQQAAPDLVFVALGSPRQERFIEALRARLPRAWWVGVGISFSFASGEVRRAPRWLGALGGEWLHRLAQEPRRLARRYLVHGLPFAALLLVRASLRGLRARRPRRANAPEGAAARR